MCRLAILATILVATTLPVVSPTDAAPPGGGNAAALGEVVKFQGKVVSIQRNGMKAESDDGKQYVVTPPEDINRLIYTIDHDPSLLRPGMPVRAFVALNAQGQPTGPVRRIELFTMVPTGGMNGRQKDRFEPGYHPEKHGTPPGTPGDYIVVGQLMNMTADAVMIGTKPRPLMAPVGGETKIVHKHNTLAMAREGDAVEVAGFAVPGREGMVQGDKIQVTGTLPPEGESPKSKRRQRRQRRSRGGDDGASAGDATAGDATDAEAAE